MQRLVPDRLARFRLAPSSSRCSTSSDARPAPIRVSRLAPTRPDSQEGRRDLVEGRRGVEVVLGATRAELGVGVDEQHDLDEQQERERAEARGIPYQRFIREALEQAVARE